MSAISSSPTDATSARGPHFGTCGGCSLQDYPYDAQLVLKKDKVLASLAGIEGLPAPSLVGAPDIWNYRNKMEFSFGDVYPPVEGRWLKLGMKPKGRWYEILRTPNDRQKYCYAAYQVWTKKAADRFAIAQHCRKGSRTGPLEVVQTDARLLGHPSNAKFEASFFGGLIRKNYWVIDRADDYSWMIASSSDGKYPAVLARTPGLSPARQAELKRRMAQLGLPTGQLQAVGAP